MKLSEVFTEKEAIAIAAAGFECLGDLSQLNDDSIIDFRGEAIKFYNPESPENMGKFTEVGDGDYEWKMAGPDKPYTFLTMGGYVNKDGKVTHLQFDARWQKFNCLKAIKAAVETGKVIF